MFYVHFLTSTKSTDLALSSKQTGVNSTLNFPYNKNLAFLRPNYDVLGSSDVIFFRSSLSLF